jgi:hypothetical protein
MLDSPAGCVRRGVFLIEDALRTASLPGSDRQCILVRSFALGRIDVRESPMALARSLQRKWHELARYAVPASSPGAIFAPAVSFPSRERAFAIYLAGVLRGARRREWFWRCVLPPRSEIQSGAELFLNLARSCATAHNGDALRVLDLLHDLERLEALPMLVGELEAGHVQEAWALLFPRSQLEAQTESRLDREAGVVSIPQIYCRILKGFLAGRPANGAVVTWTAAMAVLAARPRMISSPDLLLAAARQVEQSLLAALPASSQRPDLELSSISERPAREAGAPLPASDIAVETPENPAVVPEARRPVQESPPEVGDLARAAAILTATAPETAITDAGGLFFVLPVLDRLGFAPTSPELLPALLRNIARSIQASPNDPIFEALGEPIPHAAVRHWRRTVRRYLRATVRMSLRRIVRRPAQVVITRTHVDVFFAIGQADIRIRRHGLDLDPGWAPALGKVIAYHYGDE